MDLNLTSLRYGLNIQNPGDSSAKSVLVLTSLIFQAGISFFTIAGNLLVIIAIVLVKVLRQQPKNYIILSLAIADLLVGAFVVPIKIALTGNNQVWEGGRYACYIWITVDILSSTTSISCLTTLSVDRHIAILHPLFYRVNSTPTAVYGAVAVTWILSIFLTIPYLFLAIFYRESNLESSKFAACVYYPPHWLQIFSAISFLWPLSVILFVSGNVLRVLHSRKVEMNSKSALRPLSSDEASHTQSVSTQFFTIKLMESLQEKKGCIMIGIVTSVFAFCWVPFFTLMLLEGVNGVLGNEWTVPNWTFDALLWLGYFNSCVNPLVYTMFSRDFRFAFKELICLRGSTLNAKIRNEAYSKQVQTSSGNGSRTSSANQGQALNPAVSDPEVI